jgi:hypothetical protein
VIILPFRYVIVKFSLIGEGNFQDSRSINLIPLPEPQKRDLCKAALNPRRTETVGAVLASVAVQQQWPLEKLGLD